MPRAEQPVDAAALGELNRHELGGVPNADRPLNGLVGVVLKKLLGLRSQEESPRSQKRNNELVLRADIIVGIIVNWGEQEGIEIIHAAVQGRTNGRGRGGVL